MISETEFNTIIERLEEYCADAVLAHRIIQALNTQQRENSQLKRQLSNVQGELIASKRMISQLVFDLDAARKHENCNQL